jgi:hypothetical protein
MIHVYEQQQKVITTMSRKSYSQYVYFPVPEERFPISRQKYLNDPSDTQMHDN